MALVAMTSINLTMFALEGVAWYVNTCKDTFGMINLKFLLFFFKFNKFPQCTI